MTFRVFDLYFAELLKELFRQSRFEAPNHYLPQSLPKNNQPNLRTRDEGLTAETRELSQEENRLKICFKKPY